MIKASIQEEDITIVNTYAPNIGAAPYIRQTLTDIKTFSDKQKLRELSTTKAALQQMLKGLI